MPLFQEVCRWLDLYFHGQNPQFDIQLELEGTEFQRVVWQTLLTIPYGQATTYKAVAEQVAHLLGRERMFVRAVAHAIGQNPIALIVPCHRVIGSNGSLTGYAYGLETKRFLLDLERLP